MRVAYLNPSGQLGGAEKSLLDILASLRAAEPNYAPHLIVAADGPLAVRAAALDVPVTILPLPPALARLGDGGAGGPAGRQVGRLTLLRRLGAASLGVAAYVRQLRRVLQQLAPDVVHTNGFKMHLLGLWARPRRTPVVWHIHDYVRARPLMAGLLRRAAPAVAAVITNSHSVAADVRALCGDAAPIHPVYNAIDLQAYAPAGPRLDPDQLAKLPPAAAGTVRIGLFATMARWKGHEVFLQALALVPKTLPIRAYVVGGALYQTEGSQYSIAELRRLAAQLGVTERVGFTGFVDEPASAMRACDIIVHASTQPEPFGLVIVEAMACGRAVIASQAGGAAEIISAGANALPHTPGNARQLAACIARLAANAELRAQLGQFGRATAERRFDRARLAAQLLPIYRAALARDVPTLKKKATIDEYR